MEATASALDCVLAVLRTAHSQEQGGGWAPLLRTRHTSTIQEGNPAPDAPSCTASTQAHSINVVGVHLLQGGARVRQLCWHRCCLTAMGNSHQSGKQKRKRGTKLRRTAVWPWPSGAVGVCGYACNWCCYLYKAAVVVMGMPATPRCLDSEALAAVWGGVVAQARLALGTMYQAKSTDMVSLSQPATVLQSSMAKGSRNPACGHWPSHSHFETPGAWCLQVQQTAAQASELLLTLACATGGRLLQEAVEQQQLSARADLSDLGLSEEQCKDLVSLACK
jgi:hypothetical protein